MARNIYQQVVCIHSPVSLPITLVMQPTGSANSSEVVFETKCYAGGVHTMLLQYGHVDHVFRIEHALRHISPIGSGIPNRIGNRIGDPHEIRAQYIWITMATTIIDIRKFRMATVINRVRYRAHRIIYNNRCLRDACLVNELTQQTTNHLR